MLIELYKNEYDYIYRCFSELQPVYCEQLSSTLYVDSFALYDKPIYSVNLEIVAEDIKYLYKLKKELIKRKHISKDDFEKWDKYVDFFALLGNYFSQLKM